MASISSLSGSTSSSSSIYGNRTYNIISGLASGLDTESLISGVIQSYQQKIQSLQQKNTKLQWQQEAVQSISDKLVEFYRGYATFAYSKNNLASSSFFTSSVKTTANGTFANLVSASGKSTSEIVLNAVNRLATAAKATTSANKLDRNIHVSDDGKQVTATASGKLDFSDTKLSTLSGSLTLTYGGNNKITLDFEDGELFEKPDGTFDAEGYKNAIVEKLKEQEVSFSSGSSATADTLIGVDVAEDGTVSFYDKSVGQNSVTITDASGNLESMIENGVSGEASVMKLKLTKDDATGGYTGATNTIKAQEYLEGKSITVTLNGTSKTIELPDADGDFVKNLNAALNESFGNNKVTVTTSSDGKLAFTTDNGSSLSVTTSDSGVGKVLGLGSSLTNYLDTSKTLEDLDLNIPWDDLTANSDGKYDLVINGKLINSYSKDTELNTILNDINSNTEAGVNVSFSKVTGQFVFTAKDTGAGGRVEIKDGLGAAIFGAIDPSNTSSSDYTYDPGQDAEFSVSINGGEAMTLTRSSNSFDMDGMSITLSGTFNVGKDVSAIPDSDKVTFTSKTDADPIVDAVKKMVEDFNSLIKEVKDAYSSMPLEDSSGARYEPLTDEEKEGMSDSAIENYEEKAKTGILFMDSDLSSLYNELRNAITVGGSDGAVLRSIGIDTAYSDGLTTLTFDEEKFRQALESDPDKVQEAFTKSKEYGAATDGLMARLTAVTDRYASTSGVTKGILIEKAGSKYAPSAALDNTLLNQMKDVEKQISTWQSKMSDKVDYYTNKFTQLELLINQMNSQSASLSGLLGG